MKLQILKKTAAVLALTLLSAAALSGCEEKIKVDVRLTYDATNDALISEDASLDYRFASVSYEPADVGDPYADWDGIILYAVDGYAPEKLLTEEFTGVGGLLYAYDSPLPTLAELDADRILICRIGTSKTTCLAEIDEKEVVAQAVSYLTDGENVPLPEDGTSSLSMKFHSNEHSGIYYSVSYISVGEDENRRVYLYDRGDTKKCVEVPYELFLGWVYSEEDEVTGGYDLSEGGEVTIAFGQ